MPEELQVESKGILTRYINLSSFIGLVSFAALPNMTPVLTFIVYVLNVAFLKILLFKKVTVVEVTAVLTCLSLAVPALIRPEQVGGAIIGAVIGTFSLYLEQTKKDRFLP